MLKVFSKSSEICSKKDEKEKEEEFFERYSMDTIIHVPIKQVLVNGNELTKKIFS